MSINPRVRGENFRSSGFSMMELMVVVAVLGFLMYSLVSVMVSQQRGMKNLDQANSAINIIQTIKMSSVRPDECRVLLDLDATPVKIKKVDLPGQTGSTAQSYVQDFQSLTIPGVSKWVHGKPMEGWLLGSASLVFANPTLPNGLRYIASLTLGLEKENKESIGSKEIVRRIPLAITFTEFDATTLQVSECVGTGEGEPAAVCESIGGRWLTSTNNVKDAAMKARCPTTALLKERCVLDSSFILARDELADGIPCDGGVNVVGERTEECYYQPRGSAVIKSYLCPSVTGARRGNRCYFDPTSKRWGVWYFDNLGNPVSQKFTCDRGVKVSSRANSLEQLNWNERLYLSKFNDPYADEEAAKAYSVEENNQLIETVEKCYYEPDSDKFNPCNNTIDPASGYIASAGSCVFVKDIKLINPDNTVQGRIDRCQDFNSDCPTALTNYTGWIRVHSDYPRIVAEKASGKVFTEARGVPCFRVEVNTSEAKAPISPATTVLAKTSAAPTLAMKDAPEIIRKCSFSGTTASTAMPPSAVKRTILPCSNEAAGMTGDTDDYVGLNTAGTANDIPSKLDAGTCWHVTDIPVKNYSASYTGWVRLKKAAPDWGAFKRTEFENTYSLHRAGAYVVDGDPCDAVYYDP